MAADEAGATSDDDGSFHVFMIKVKHGSHQDEFGLTRDFGDG